MGVSTALVFLPHSFPATPSPACSTVWDCCDPGALGLVELHKNGLSPSTQPAQISVQSISALQQINTPATLVSSAKWLRVHSSPLSESLVHILNRTGSSTELNNSVSFSLHLTDQPFHWVELDWDRHYLTYIMKMFSVITETAKIQIITLSDWEGTLAYHDSLLQLSRWGPSHPVHL